MRSPGRIRNWAPDCITVGTAPKADTCRVCSEPIAEGEKVLRRTWNDTTLSHVRCGWFCARDTRFVDVDREAKAAIEAAKKGAA